ncbi:hypothetical protein KIH27_18535 [Mycobacterium sp. M1]|uniref:Phage tail protein n=1 Tax=Mycolicibacter acidiphilus TaxID=2835306 RepID=A0ABS5RNJ1_9MYCO|nr:hypothetical protein [Mycolicibacter acidiphilus]MBS9535587.1 hypothetical protein [Mycolicibacter acidiphilus]
MTGSDRPERLAPQLLTHYLNTLNIPAALRRGLDTAQAVTAGLPMWPPQPGCAPSPDGALLRLWARLDLAAWITHAPNAFGPHRPGELDMLASVVARLRTAGEGARILWGLDLVPAEQWVTQPAATSFAAVELICAGPALPAALVNQIDATLTRFGWSYDGDPANCPCVINGTDCFETSWREGNTQSGRSANATSAVENPHRMLHLAAGPGESPV